MFSFFLNVSNFFTKHQKKNYSYLQTNTLATSYDNWELYVPKGLGVKKLSKFFKSDYSHIELHKFGHYANLISRSSLTVYLSFSVFGLINVIISKLHLDERLLNSSVIKSIFDIVGTKDSRFVSLYDFMFLSNSKIFHGLYYTPIKFYVFFVIFSFLICFYADAWIEEINVESTLFGKYTAKVRGTLVYGFYLFLLSELMVFFGFFWSLYVLVGLGQEVIGSMWFTLTVSEYVQLFADPLLGTITLFLSGYLVNYSFLRNRIRETRISRFYLFIAIVYGLYFLSIQGAEYNNLADTCELKAAWSIFYMITGFHGFHVFVGVTFLVQVFNHVKNYDLPGDRMISFFMAGTYWHFVDWVWILVLYRLYDIFNYSFLFFLG